jgi:hypothetical protein
LIGGEPPVLKWLWPWLCGQFQSPEEGERPPLEAATKQRLVKTVTDWEDLVCAVVICEMYRTVTA